MDNDKSVRYLHELVTMLMEKNGSDLFITAGSPPALKVSGEILRVGQNKLTPQHSEILVRSVMNDRQRAHFDAHQEVGFSLNFPDLARFRVSVFRQRNSAGMVMRLIPSQVPTLHQLNLPTRLGELAMADRGMILFVGGTGCGKSSSLAAMVDHRNERSRGHVITIEDPIEFYHQHKSCLVNQREIGVDAESYGIALKSALRQAPNVILVGEIRDRETMDYAINFAETGHLFMSTLHANNTNQALDRIINFFPEARRPQLLMDLAFNLRAFVSQRLIRRADQEGLIPAVEILLNTPLMSELIFQGRLHEIKPAMAKSSEQGLLTFDQSLFELYEAGKISYESALRYADSTNNLRLQIKLHSKRPLPDSLKGSVDEIKLKMKG
ncbi:MAG: PilT/PilU family type 4a pilus ATPase [Reinekea sp.]|nr:PilT/PilU family type 4a pilus ATPase [Reinekea sp.]